MDDFSFEDKPWWPRTILQLFADYSFNQYFVPKIVQKKIKKIEKVIFRNENAER